VTQIAEHGNASGREGSKRWSIRTVRFEAGGETGAGTVVGVEGGGEVGAVGVVAGGEIGAAAEGAAGAAAGGEVGVESALVSINGLHKSYGATPVLRGIDLDVTAGALTAVLGPSGSGKTTLLRLLAGFERADGGRIRLGARTVDDARNAVPPEKRHIGYVPQDGALFPHLTVRENIGFGLRRARRKCGRIEELLELTSLDGMAERYPHQLSGGQQQRVALARALAPRPELVLLDEPFSALDAALRASVRAEVLAILRATGCTAILVTHDQDEALSMADRIAVLREGRVVQYGTARELYDTPADPQLACFLGEANLLDATLTARGADLGPLGLLPVLPGCALGRATASDADERPEGAERGGVAGGNVTALVRPEQFSVAVRGADAAGEGEVGEAGIAGLVERCEYYGHDAMLTVRPQPKGADNVRAFPEKLLVRLPAGAELPAGGSVVTLTVRSPIAVWHAGFDAAAA
jgi:iron(III) transport system ATP-binding protein